MQAKSATNLKVIDVSHHQNDRGKIDWAKVKTDGVAGVFVKATEGGSGHDKQFSSNAQGASSAGLKVGFYHYAHPELNDAGKEAANFANAISGCAADFPHVLDVEGEAATVPGEQLTAWCVEWLETVEKLTGRPAMLYTGASFAKSNLRQPLGKWPLWIAHYDTDRPMANDTWSEWAVFQYTSEGTVAGIVGNVDVNAMEKAFFDNFAGTPADSGSTDEDSVKIVVNDKLAARGRLIDGHAYLPVRELAEALGVPVEWNASEAKPYVAGKSVTAFKLIGGSAYIGVRAAAELLGGQASFDGQTEKVYFYR
ncbi:GH25 family lysozyme [Paenibacillus glycinis]|uniref:Glycoside hydrolase n=1 Tax=Paenibacillus glycinis TaxID=2697035 RepID=A0ABW9XQ85_9BACL|nr:GH25 family lysozyme [Paenibacillus glycinis]NBD24811.1 glycoside hydrolase [Paenibacillus glycinis]